MPSYWWRQASWKGVSCTSERGRDDRRAGAEALHEPGRTRNELHPFIMPRPMEEAPCQPAYQQPHCCEQVVSYGKTRNLNRSST